MFISGYSNGLNQHFYKQKKKFYKSEVQAI